MLQDERLLAEVGLDTAKSEPSKVPVTNCLTRTLHLQACRTSCLYSSQATSPSEREEICVSTRVGSRLSGDILPGACCRRWNSHDQNASTKKAKRLPSTCTRVYTSAQKRSSSFSLSQNSSSLLVKFSMLALTQLSNYLIVGSNSTI